MPQRYVVLLDGRVCAAGLEWREALVEAGRLLRVLARTSPDDSVITISELELGEPRATWKRIGWYWDFRVEPIWHAQAA